MPHEDIKHIGVLTGGLLVATGWRVDEGGRITGKVMLDLGEEGDESGCCSNRRLRTLYLSGSKGNLKMRHFIFFFFILKSLLYHSPVIYKKKEALCL